MRLRARHKSEQADELLLERAVAGGGPTISSPYAAKQAKALAKDLCVGAGSQQNAQKVLSKFAKLPEARLFTEFANNSTIELNARLIDNVLDFFYNHLRSKGTRHAEDQNIRDAILAALVDEQMVEDKMINAVATLLGVRWEAVKLAVLCRMKLDDEESEKQLPGGVWTQRKRSVLSDKYRLPGLYAFCNDEMFFRFVSSGSQPLREHTGVGEYKIHWAREVPNQKKDVVDIYLNDDRARKYVDMDRAANNGFLPERTTLTDNVCFCLK